MNAGERRSTLALLLDILYQSEVNPSDQGQQIARLVTRWLAANGASGTMIVQWLDDMQELGQ